MKKVTKFCCSVSDRIGWFGSYSQMNVMSIVQPGSGLHWKELAVGAVCDTKNI